MKITLKTLKQVPYDVEFTSDEITVGELKKLAETTHKIEASTIKLVFNGTVLKDESTLKSYGITEGNILVMMISKTKVHNKPVETIADNQPQVKNEVKKEEKPINSNSNVNNNVTNNQNTTTSNVTNNQPIKKDYTNEINTLVEMGFPKEYAESAIKAARGNVTVAIEFLYNGIPDVPLDEHVQSNNNSSGEQGGNVSGGESEVIKRIASLVKILCANDPSKLQNIILGLQQTQPELLNLIKNNEAEFKNLISQPITEEDLAVFQEFNAQGGRQGGQGTQGAQNSQGQSGQGGQGVIKLSKTDYDAVQRLKEFGFSELDSAEAYFACDKNEEMALNFLFEMKSQDVDNFSVPQTNSQSNTQTTIPQQKKEEESKKEEENKENKDEENKKDN